MSYRKFGPNDVVLNTMRMFPSVNFFIYNTKVYYNNTPHQPGAFGSSVSGSILNITSSTSGGISLFEYNIDRSGLVSAPGTTIPNDQRLDWSKVTGLNPKITPYIQKDSARTSYKTVGKLSFRDEFYTSELGAPATILQHNYPLTASITRQLMGIPEELPAHGAGHRTDHFHLTPCGADGGTTPYGKFEPWPYLVAAGGTEDTWTGKCHSHLGFIEGITAFKDEFSISSSAPAYRHFYALKNRLNHYGAISEHYMVSSSFNGGWNKAEQAINMISVPSIFYGSKIKEGTLSLKWYVSGTLAAEVRDTKENGELIEVSGSNTGLVAGVVLYNEGIILLTGSWTIDDNTSLPLVDGTITGGARNPKWIYFGIGANDGVSADTVYGIANNGFASASFDVSFKGTSETQVQTMFAKANRGRVNYSNNPTFFEYGQNFIEHTSSKIYEENPNKKIFNTISSSFTNHSASFERSVYISKVGIYDKNKNLIAIATLANPVKKKEDEEYTFKIKMDF